MRRHRCEICRLIFVCHLCKPRFTHPAHSQTGMMHWEEELGKFQRIDYVCSECERKFFVLCI